MKNRNFYKEKNNYNFREITAKENIFNKAKEENEGFLDSFKAFVNSQGDKTKRKTSGTASSYTNYLVRLFVFVNEVKDVKIDDIEFFNELKFMQKTSGFKKYNEKKGRFPNSTINDYFKYWFEKAFEEDDLFDNLINDVYETKEDSSLLEKATPRGKPRKVNKNNQKIYARNAYITKHVKERSKWLCEFKSDHKTFINRNNDLQYVEAHHLIPMALQDNFEYSLDVPSNIVSLCPNCHRMIHHGKKEDVEEILEYLYSKYENDMNLSGIKVSFSELLSFYGIDKR